MEKLLYILLWPIIYFWSGLAFPLAYHFLISPWDQWLLDNQILVLILIIVVAPIWTTAFLLGIKQGI